MIVSDLEVIPVSVPFIEPFEITGGVAENARHVIVKAIGSNGEVGYGESAPMSSYSKETQAKVIKETEDILPNLIGMDPLRIEKLHMEMGRRKVNTFAAAGIDIAMHDLAARSLGIAINSLLGGAVAGSVDLSWAIGFKSAEKMADESLMFSKKGFRTIKIKIGKDAEKDIERVRVVRESVGQKVNIKVDANQGYNLDTSIEVGERLQELDVSVFEQPLPRDHLQGLAELRRRIDIPVMVDESLYNMDDGRRVLDLAAADIFNIKIMKPGGLHPSLKLGHMAEGWDMSCMLGSMPELGIGTLAGLQLAVTSDVFDYGAELIGPWMLQDHLLSKTPELDEGKIILPKGKGLGIDIDERKIEKYRT